MKIGICDDESSMREYGRGICQRLLDEHTLQGEVLVFDSGESLLQCMDKIDLLILDIQMKGMDGITLKNQLQQWQNSPYIIFVTNYDDRMQQAFGNKVLGFVRKEDMEKQLPQLFQTAMHFIDDGVIIGDGYQSSDIIAIQAEQEYVKLYLDTGDAPSVRMSLKKLEAELKGYMFLRVHRSWLVNLHYVDKVEKRQIIVNGMAIPVSVRHQKKVKDAYIEYLRKDIRY